MTFFASSVQPVIDSSGLHIKTGNCVKEGKSPGIGGHGGSGGPQCCPGLTEISEKAANGKGACAWSPAGFAICAKCGDGICGEGEDYCNCPKDCINRAVTDTNTGTGAGMTCAELCRSKSYAGSYCSIYGGGPLPAGDKGTPACAEGGDNVGEAKDCNSQTIVDAGKTCCCLKEMAACKEPGEKFPEQAQTTVCCPGLNKITVYDMEAWQKAKEAQCPSGTQCLVSGRPVPSGQAVCTNCGNGTCETDENLFNCPTDCATAADKKNCLYFPDTCGAPPPPATPKPINIEK